MNKADLGIKIRKATINDLPALQSLYVQTIENTCQNDYDATQLNVWKLSVENTERWTNALQTQYFLVAEIDYLIVGFGSLKDGEYVDFMYVHNDYLRKGIADKIYAELEQESDRLGIAQLTSDVSKTAKPFFEKKGFIVEKENNHIIRGVEINNYHMKKIK